MPNTCCDLHLHSYYSDGCNSPADLLHYAAENGLKTLSLTDHDTLAGLEEAGNVANSLGLELIPGVELTCSWFGIDIPQAVDLLGYFFDAKNPALIAACQAGLADLEKRMQMACGYLGELGMQLSYFDVQAVNPRYAGAGQLIQALVESRAGAGLDGGLPYVQPGMAAFTAAAPEPGTGHPNPARRGWRGGAGAPGGGARE